MWWAGPPWTLEPGPSSALVGALPLRQSDQIDVIVGGILDTSQVGEGYRGGNHCLDLRFRGVRQGTKAGCGIAKQTKGPRFDTRPLGQSSITQAIVLEPIYACIAFDPQAAEARFCD